MAADSIDRVSFRFRDGLPDRMTVESAGGRWSGRRVDPIPAGGLGEFAGSFYSDELETTWTIAVEDGALVARHLMQGDVHLTPVVRDLFDGDAGFMSELRFLRDGRGRIDGLLVSAGRINNVRFRRLER